MPGPLLSLEVHVYDAYVLETAVMVSEISIIAGSKEILSVHHFTVLVILPICDMLLHFLVLGNSPMRSESAPAFSSHRYFIRAIYSRIFHSCIFHPCNFVRIAFSTPAFSVNPTRL